MADRARKLAVIPTKVIDRWLLCALLVVAIAIEATACGDSGGSSPPGTSETATTPASVNADLSDFEEGILADGEVTRAEYESAVLAVLSCLDSAGIEHSGPTPEPGTWGVFRYSYTYTYRGAGSATSSADRSYDDCFHDYEDDVLAAWVQQEVISGSELAAAEERVAECARTRGVDVENYDELFQMLRDPSIMEIYVDCERNVGEELVD